MLSLKAFEPIKIKNLYLIRGGSIKTDGGSRSGTHPDGTKYCFTYTSDCTVVDGDVTTTKFCDICPC